MAREVSQTVETTTRELQTATSQFAVHRDVPTTVVPTVLRSLFETTLDARWPRASIIRRAGATRRRTHTAVGAVVAVAAVAVAGAVVSDPAGVRPTLDREPVAALSTPSAPAPSAPQETDVLPTSAMVSVDRVASLLPGRDWEELSTHDNTHGDGLVMPCQQARYADPRVVDALVREIKTPRGADPRRSVVASTEASRNERAAGRAMGRLTEWFARCQAERSQLLSTSTVTGVGDEALQIVLRDWADPVTTTVVGLARTGRFVVTTTSSVRDDRLEAPQAQTLLLAAAVDGVCDLPVDGVCDLPGGSACSRGTPKTQRRDALPVGDPATMLVEGDLPPVSSVDAPWVGTRPEKVRGQNAAATRCDKTSFSGTTGGERMRASSTRTFLIPEAELPVEFGLTETVGRLPEKQARSFVSTIRRKMELAVWHVTVEVTENRSVKYFMAVARTGGQLLQLGFIPAPGVEMDRGAFLALAERGLERLRSGS